LFQSDDGLTGLGRESGRGKKLVGGAKKLAFQKVLRAENFVVKSIKIYMRNLHR